MLKKLPHRSIITARMKKMSPKAEAQRRGDVGFDRFFSPSPIANFVGLAAYLVPYSHLFAES